MELHIEMGSVGVVTRETWSRCGIIGVDRAFFEQ